jgi:hypothetical protein
MLAIPERARGLARRTPLPSLSAPSSGSATVFVIALLRAPFVESDRSCPPAPYSRWEARTLDGLSADAPALLTQILTVPSPRRLRCMSRNLLAAEFVAPAQSLEGSGNCTLRQEFYHFKRIRRILRNPTPPASPGRSIPADIR